MTLQKFIKNKSYLVWYVKNPTKLSDEAIVEAVINYGDFDDVKKMIKIFFNIFFWDQFFRNRITIMRI